MGKFIHHSPVFGDERDEEVQQEQATMLDAQEQMFNSYAEDFGEEPPAHIWPNAAVMRRNANTSGNGSNAAPFCFAPGSLCVRDPDSSVTMPKLSTGDGSNDSDSSLVAP